jgi:hypothetical protein
MGQWLVFGWFWSWGTSDTQLARRKLGKNSHPNHGGHHCPMATMGRGSGIKIGGKKIALNAIFRVVSCLYIIYDLTCSILLKTSTHSHSYKAYCCFTVLFTGDWLVTRSSPLMIKPQWCLIPLQSVALCQTAHHILLLSHLKCSYKQSVTYK